MAFCELVPEAKRKIKRQLSEIERERGEIQREIDDLNDEISKLENKLYLLDEEVEDDKEWMNDELRRLNAFCP